MLGQAEKVSEFCSRGYIGGQSVGMRLSADWVEIARGGRGTGSIGSHGGGALCGVFFFKHSDEGRRLGYAWLRVQRCWLPRVNIEVFGLPGLSWSANDMHWCCLVAHRNLRGFEGRSRESGLEGLEYDGAAEDRKSNMGEGVIAYVVPAFFCLR